MSRILVTHPPRTLSLSLPAATTTYRSRVLPVALCHWLDHRPITSPIHLLLFFISLSPKPGPASGALSLAGPQANHLLLFSSRRLQFIFFPGTATISYLPPGNSLSSFPYSPPPPFCFNHRFSQPAIIVALVAVAVLFLSPARFLFRWLKALMLRGMARGHNKSGSPSPCSLRKKSSPLVTAALAVAAA